MKESKNINTLEYVYREMEIHFLVNPNDKNVMINATEMAKVFGKRTTHYLENEKTKELISKLELTGKSVNSDYKVLENRGHMGYYFNEILALDFAAWLDVDFRIWIYRTIRDLLTQETKIVKTAVNTLKEKEEALQLIISNVRDNGNDEAKQLLNAISELELAKKGKTKAVSMFSRQMSMKL